MYYLATNFCTDADYDTIYLSAKLRSSQSSSVLSELPAWLTFDSDKWLFMGTPDKNTLHLVGNISSGSMQ